MSNVKILENKLCAILIEIKDAVDLSIELRAQSTVQKSEVVKLWENFIAQFFGYIKQKSREKSDNILAGISWARVKF